MAKYDVLASAYTTDIESKPGIGCFDAWMRELVETGYLHNHARMWTASIWIFTLRLPWELGADFFLRHLVDGDPASNTLSWRWVAGLHTKGKTYLARASNISKYTEGRFRPVHQLANEAPPLTESGEHPKRALPEAGKRPDAPYLLLITEDDCRPGDWLEGEPDGVLGLLATKGRSMQPVGAAAQAFATDAVTDALSVYGAGTPDMPDAWAPPLIAAAEEAGVRHIVTGYAPVGPVASRLAAAGPALAEAGIALHQIRRTYDIETWPHATKGFFGLKMKIPSVLEALSLA